MITASADPHQPSLPCLLSCTEDVGASIARISRRSNLVEVNGRDLALCTCMTGPAIAKRRACSRVNEAAHGRVQRSQLQQYHESPCHQVYAPSGAR